MKVLITGASGLVGLALTSFLKAKGHEVIVLSRHSGPGIRVWSPETGFLDLKDVEGVDAVAGGHAMAPVISIRCWHRRRRAAIRLLQERTEVRSYGRRNTRGRSSSASTITARKPP